MMDVQTAPAEIKTDLARRLNRIEGQVRGVRRMVEDDRECREIAQQLAAIRSAIHQTSVVLLRSYACRCLIEGDQSDREQVVDDLMALLGKTP